MARGKRKVPDINSSSTADIAFLLLIFFLITTIFGLIVALILQVFYNYVLAKIEALTSEMEDSSISLLDMVIKYDLKYKK